ncbi:MAG TPA: DedA family protein [Vicinamibacterales bacterium]|nr:DedA family protein [Vicinamibacterales bacterium]
MDPAAVATFIGDWGYLALLVALLATGVLSPIPEDLLLLAAGYLISAGVFTRPLTIVLAMVGVIGSDVILFYWGGWIRSGAGGRWSRQMIRPERLATVTAWFDQFGDPFVFVARLAPGTRAVAFVGAGWRGMSLRRFLFYDTLGALIWVPLLTTLGSQLGEEVGGLDRLLAQLTRISQWVVLAMVLLILVWYFLRSEQSKL